MFILLTAIIYLSFISLGLPDSLLGSAWPVMREEFGAPLSYAGIVSMVRCGGKPLYNEVCAHRRNGLESGILDNIDYTDMPFRNNFYKFAVVEKVRQGAVFSRWGA